VSSDLNTFLLLAVELTNVHLSLTYILGMSDLNLYIVCTDGLSVARVATGKGSAFLA